MSCMRRCPRQRRSAVHSAAGFRMAVWIALTTIMVLREPGPLASRILMPLVGAVVMQPLYQAALAGQGGAAGTGQAVTGMLVLFSLLALSIVGTSILTERGWRTWDRLRTTPVRSAELL